ncbi:MAG: hypothetical protein ACREXK_07955 [Gammaproteobacteria bacterium]
MDAAAELPAADRPWAKLWLHAYAYQTRALHAWPMGYPVTTLTARLGKVPARCRTGGPQLAWIGTNPGVYESPEECRQLSYA